MGNWFEQHPRKTLLLFLALIFFSAAFITEKVLAWQAPTKKSGVKRCIRLREEEPLFIGKFTPTEEDLRLADSLVKKEYPFRTDRDGFILPARVHEQPDLTLVFLGGSTTACYYVDEEKRFPYLAGRLLEAETKLRVNSYNSGVGGNYSLHSLDILLNKVIPMKPDMVIMMHNINDLAVLMYAGSYWSQDFKKGKTSPLMEFQPMAVNFRQLPDYFFPHLTQALKSLEKSLRRTLRPKQARAPDDELREIRGKKISLDRDLLLKEFKMNQQTFINICRARKITPVLMTMASRLTATPDPLVSRLTKGLEQDHGLVYQEYREIFQLFNQAIRLLAQENRVPLIDLAQAVPPDKEYIYDLVHFTNRGSGYAAGVIKEGLKPHLPGLPGGRN